MVVFYYITANQMNKNGKKTSQGKVTEPNRNNINILINFNMKDKNQGFAGKKIDNFVQIQQKNNTKIDTQTKTIEESKKNKKKTIEASEKQEKEKNFDTPSKHKTFERNKITKNNNQKTPERRDNSRGDQRSKSTNQKLIKRKNAKSVQNIRAGIKIQKNKERSASSSAQKSRSHSKSSKKLIKSNKESIKNLSAFTNMGIKNKINKAKTVVSRERQSSTGNKLIKEEDHDKIKKFMEEKKRKEKADKLKQIKEEKIKIQRIAEELRKVEHERRANASKSFVALKKTEEKEQRLPMYFYDDDDDFDQARDFQKLKKQAQKMIHDSPPPSKPIETISISKINKSDKNIHSSSKKSLKHKKVSLVHKYLNGTITSKQLDQLQLNIIKIQAHWRGFQARRSFVKKLSDEATRIRYVKNRIDNKKGNFWNDQQQNSIIKIQRDSNAQASQSILSGDYVNYNSNINSNMSDRDNLYSNLFSGEKAKQDKFKKLSLEIDQDVVQDMKREKEKLEAEENAKMLREIEELRKQLMKQTEQYRSLEEENNNLKNNIKIMSLKESRELQFEKSQEINSSDYIQIRMPKKIESPNNQPLQFPKREKQDKLEEKITKKEEQQQKASNNLSNFKKQFQIFECSSPSHAKMEQQLKTLKNKNIEGLFKKKQIKIQQKYQKKSQLFSKMLEDRIFSPRTFNIKKKQLQSKLLQQKQQIIVRLQQAKRVVGYIQDLSESDESDVQLQKKQKKQSSNRPVIRQMNFKKEKVVTDTFTNTSPHEPMPIQFNPNNKMKKDIIIDLEDNYSQDQSEDDKIYKKYWTDDIEEVHKHTLQITKKIEEALKAESQNSQMKKSSQHTPPPSNILDYNSQGHKISKQYEKQRIVAEELTHKYSKSDDLQIDMMNSKNSYDNYMEEIKEMPTETEKKAKEIFNRIDLNEQEECKSQDEPDPMGASNDNLCELLNKRPLPNSPTDQSKQVSNLYISQAQFNKKKRKEQQLSRSSSFQKSNKSLSVNNSQVDSKGFITNLTFIKQFCISVCQFIRSHQNHKQFFVDVMSGPIQYDFSQYLKSYRITINGDINSNYNTFQEEYLYPYFKIVTTKVQAISQLLFTDFLKSYEQEKLNSPRWNDPSLGKNTKQMREFFLVSIIDAFNQSLQFERPGSVYGRPLPWLQHSHILKNSKNKELKILTSPNKLISVGLSDDEEMSEQELTLDQIFGSSIARIIQWGSCLCGFIADPMPMQMGDSQINNLTDEQLNSIRQNRVGLMLQKWLLQEQEKITNSSGEYTEVILSVGEKIIEWLFVECMEEIGEL